MSSEQTPALVGIEPDATYTELRAEQCRECGEMGPLLPVDNPAWYQWFSAHADRTGHTQVFQFKVTRSAGAAVKLPRRRKLGNRQA